MQPLRILVMCVTVPVSSFHVQYTSRALLSNQNAIERFVETVPIQCSRTIRVPPPTVVTCASMSGCSSPWLVYRFRSRINLTQRPFDALL
ncbi:hypothetical protein H4582DRAFT_1351762 [Lactarius indigo]|nr:hypothetical protein H4582DRAFT_1351762 [Lactarius indigo]